MSIEQILKPHILNDYGHYSSFKEDYKLSISAIKYAMQEYSDQQNEKYRKALEKIEDEANKSAAYEHIKIIAEKALSEV